MAQGRPGFRIGPFVPPVATVMGLTGLNYSQYMKTAGLPLGLIIWVCTFFVACRTQKLTEGKVSYSGDEAVSEDFQVTPEIKRATWAFGITMLVMLVYGVAVKAGASYAIVVMLTASLVTAFASGMELQRGLTTLVQGASKMFWMFFMFILFDLFLNYVAASGPLMRSPDICSLSSTREAWWHSLCSAPQSVYLEYREPALRRQK